MPQAEIEYIATTTADCGCPEETYIFANIDLIVHFDEDGEIDAFLDGGDWGEAETRLHDLDRDAGRKKVFDWAHGIVFGPSCERPDGG